ncbi:SDR family NAD(P)-dependent oxidoreductase [Halobellus limi]|uniref:3-oxoacyl-[acyl-carrier-protein] reductase n=1 Tax=Halobellus limi TaxID=699433 RepID=A0A1H6BQC9_9EURY|nr:SDR family oxidoreductase [Halobellus limi]QCC49381.1 SDR family oxidoreductase [Halobellus limi]SEG62903.1 3-oxoacyl-[acyl-carrier-protein] reductase [Halobellus limi]
MARTAIVTGGSGGIGHACVEVLAPNYDVLVHYNSDLEGAETAVKTVEEHGNRAAVHQCDIADPDAVAEMVETAEAELGQIDLLVNNGAVFLETALEDITRDEIDLEVDVNLKGTVHCTKAALPSIRKSEYGRIITIASTSGPHGSPTDPVYAATKGGVISFTKSIARMYASDGILANVVAPGPTATPMMREERRPGIRESSPLGRLTRPEEVADAVEYFASATGVTGEVLVVDGGRNI